MSTSITVQWGTVPCADQNGPITGYSVRYGEMGSGSTRNESATGNEAVISGLQTSTNYTVEVAAETSVGRGDYSEPIIVTTDSKISCQTLQHTLYSVPSAAISATVVSAMPTSILIRWRVWSHHQDTTSPIAILRTLTVSPYQRQSLSLVMLAMAPITLRVLRREQNTL